ncbi:MAG: sel1 repeat family protein [Proteobacteria bacterium]|nr:sel1 repeat family protein [Pseudomonadota bacterium]MBU1709376.1 sel1 repeat family protein [Pseudomonadota bacterium]
MKKLFLLLPVLLIVAAGLFWKEYNSPFQQLSREAKRGDARSAYTLADHYYFGQNDTKVDLQKARSWYKKAGDKGHVQAQFVYGYMLYKGKGGSVDLKGAEEWFEKAASGGNPDAMYFLAGMYYYGKGVPQNEELSAERYKQGAEAGHPACQYHHAINYGFQSDTKNYLKWMNRSAQQGDRDALFNFCEHTYSRSGGWLEDQDLVAAYRWCTLALKTGKKEAREKLDSLGNKLTPTIIAQQDLLVEQFMKDIQNENVFDPHIQ